MVGRGQVQHIRMPQRLRQYAVGIQGNRLAGDPGGGVNLLNFAVARVLHGVALVPAQKLHQKVIQKVGSRAYQNLVR